MSEEAKNENEDLEAAAAEEAQEQVESEQPANDPDLGLVEEDGAFVDVASLESEIASLKDQLLRARAEAENTRRRAEKDKSDAKAYAVTSFARDLLNVGDNISRAMQTLPESYDESLKAFVEGVDMTGRELLNVFERFGIKQVSPEAGDKFDPQQHQAMFEVPTADHPAGSVVQVVAVGYMIKDRLLRPAMVGVAKAAEGGVDTTA